MAARPDFLVRSEIGETTEQDALPPASVETT
jgi:hypothetical protein